MHTHPAFLKSEITYRTGQVRDDVRAARRSRARRRRDRGLVEGRDVS